MLRDLLVFGFGFTMGIAFFALWMSFWEQDAQEQAAMHSEGIWP